MSAEISLDPVATTGDAAPADPWRRLMGAVYECVILFGVLWFADYVFSSLTRFEGEPGLLRHVFQVFQALVLGAYFTGFWMHGRRTVPMKTMGLQLLDRRGAPLGFGRALARFLAALAMILLALALGHALRPGLYLLLFAPYVWTFFDRDRQSLYDLIAGTRLVYLPAQDTRALRR